MPRARKAPAVEEPVVVEEVAEVEEQPVVEAEESFEEEPETEEPEAEIEPTVDAPAAVSHDGGRDLPFAEGEEIVAQAVRDDADLIIVTNFGRKVRIDPDGNYEVVTGPPFTQEVPAIPKPPRATWHD